MPYILYPSTRYTLVHDKLKGGLSSWQLSVLQSDIMMYVFVRRTLTLPHTSKSSHHSVQSSSKGSRRWLQRWNSKREASFASVTRSNSCNEPTMYPKDRADESNYARYIGVEPPLVELAKLEELLKSWETFWFIVLDRLFRDASCSRADLPEVIAIAVALKFESKDSSFFFSCSTILNRSLWFRKINYLTYLRVRCGDV